MQLNVMNDPKAKRRWTGKKPLCMQGCGGLWKGWKAKGLLHWNFSAEAAG